MINLGRAVEHPFQDKDWAVKMLIGAGISLVPILNFAMMGYSLAVLRNTARGEDLPLPRWDDLGKHFMDGLILFIVDLIYAIPILVLVGGLTFLGMAFGITSDSMARSTRDALGTGLAVITAGIACLAVIYGLVLAFITPALYIQVARTGQVGPAFHLNEIGALIKRNMGDYIVVVVMPLVIGLAIGVGFTVINVIPFVGLCITFLLIPFILLVTPYIQIVLGHLYGQLITNQPAAVTNQLPAG
jgi:Protein of unknown function (DUF4013)